MKISVRCLSDKISSFLAIMLQHNNSIDFLATCALSRLGPIISLIILDHEATGYLLDKKALISVDYFQ